MKKNKNLLVVAILLAVLPIAFSACIKDQCKKTHTYTFYEPIYRTKAEVRANIKSNTPRQLENTGKFYILGNYIFLNEVDKGVHVIDNSNPSQPRNIAFIDIPGNVDLAVKGNILYADLYTDLVAIDISNPAAIAVKKIVDFVFPERLYSSGFNPDNNKIIVDWKRIDTTVTESCDGPQWQTRNPGLLFASADASGIASASSGSPIGMGGSMARFAVVNNFMYAVDHHTLKSISLANAADPVLNGNINAGWDIETIYPFKNKLFLGSMNGLFIFDITNPATPVAQGSFNHARACDPVVADDKYAYVTLRAGSNCGPTSNELDIVDIQDLQSPFLKKAYPMTGPKGLSKDNNLLFICDGTVGVKVYNAADVTSLQLLSTITGMEPTDVITYNNLAIVVAKDGIYQYDYSNTSNIRLLSKITINK